MHVIGVYPPSDLYGGARLSLPAPACPFRVYEVESRSTAGTVSIMLHWTDYVCACSTTYILV